MKQVAPAPAPVCDPRWYISIGGGIDIDFEATDFVSDTNFTLMSTTPPSTPQNEIYKGRSWGDVYDPIYRIQGELGYVLNITSRFLPCLNTRAATVDVSVVI